MKNGFTTTILHSDLESPIEHFSVHKPMHLAVAFGYPDARDLAKVFKGELPGYAYGRQGNPTTAALEVEDQQDGGRHRHRLLQHRHGRHCRHFHRAAARRRSCRVELVPVRQYQQPVRHLQHAGLRHQLCRCDRRGRTWPGRIRPNTRLVFVETIANPRTQIADLARIGELCARRGLALRGGQHDDVALSVPAEASTRPAWSSIH